MFTGFTQETIDFLWGIRLNNYRDWFEAHKEEYQRTLYQPMKALAAEVFPAFEKEPNLEQKLSRIYKDARLHPAVPYKESLWLSMRPAHLHWSQQPTLFFEITPQGYHYGFILLQPQAEKMERWRREVQENPEEFLSLVKKLQRKTGLTLTGDSYKRGKPCSVEALKPYFQLKNFSMEVSRMPDELLFSPSLPGEVVKTLKALLPLYRYFLRYTGS